MTSTRVAYLSGNTVYVIAVGLDNPTLREELAWSLPRADLESFGGLACGPNNTLLLHMSRISLDPAHLGASAKIVTADVVKRTLTPINVATDISLTWPKLSPDQAWIAATAINDGTRSLAIISRETGLTEVFPWQFPVSADAWSPSGEKILVTTFDVEGQHSSIAEFDRETRNFRRVTDGGKPVASGTTGYVAYLSSDRQLMSVIDNKNVTVATFHGFFSRIIGWIDDSKLLFVSVVGLVTQMGFADILSGKIETRDLASFGEISGACILRE